MNKSIGTVACAPHLQVLVTPAISFIEMLIHVVLYILNEPENTQLGVAVAGAFKCCTNAFWEHIACRIQHVNVWIV